MWRKAHFFVSNTSKSSDVAVTYARVLKRVTVSPCCSTSRQQAVLKLIDTTSKVHFVSSAQAADMYDELGVDPEIVARWQEMPVPGWPTD